MMFLLRKALEDAAQWDLLGHEQGGSWRKEPTAKRTFGRQDTPSKGKVWHVTPHDHPDNARAAYVINTLGRAVLNAPQSKLVRNGGEGKLALARLPVPATHKEAAVDEKLTGSRQYKQALPFHAFVGAGPADFQHFSAGDNGPMSIVSRGTGLHVGAQGPGKEFDAAHDISELVKHPDAKTDPDIRAGVKRIMNMSPAQIERAVGGAGFHPEVADELITNLKHRQQLLGQHLSSGAFGGGSKDNEKFLDRSREEDLFAGAPPQIKNLPPGKRERALAALKTELGNLVKTGWEGRNWYKESADKFKAVAGGNMEDVQKMAALHAIFSPQQAPAANTESAIRAYLHYKMGRPRDQLRGGHTDEQEEKARALLYDDQWHGGIKTNAFYRNLMTELSGEGDKVPDPARGDLQHTTNDIWVGRAFHYPNAGEGGLQGSSGFTQAQHRFMTRVQNEVAQKYGISAHRAQAALWVAAKGQSLGNMEAGAESFKHGVESAQGHVISSLTPHPESNMLPGFENLPAAAKQELHHRLLDALHDDEGRFLPTHMSGYGSEPAEAIGPNGLFKFSALTSRNLGPTVSQEKQANELLAQAKKRGGTKDEKAAALQKFVEAKAAVDRATARRKYVQGPVIHQVRGIASLLAHLTGQKHIDVQRPVPRTPTNVSEQNAIHVKTDTPFKNAELAKFAKVLHREIGGAGDAVTPVPYEHGVYAINRHGVPNEVFHKAAKRAAIETLGLSANPKDEDKLQGALFEDKSRPDVKFDRFFAHATRASNDYKEFPNGEAHRSRADAALGPTLSRRILRELAPKLRGVYEGFAKKHKLKLNLPEAYRLVEAQAKEEHRESHKKVSSRIAASEAGRDREMTTVLAKSVFDTRNVRAPVFTHQNPYFAKRAIKDTKTGTVHPTEGHEYFHHDIIKRVTGDITALNSNRYEHGFITHGSGEYMNQGQLDRHIERHEAVNGPARPGTRVPFTGNAPARGKSALAMFRSALGNALQPFLVLRKARSMGRSIRAHDPYFSHRAVRVRATGQIHEAMQSDEPHLDIIRRAEGGKSLSKEHLDKYEVGFIGHGGEYRPADEFDRLAAEHIRKHGVQTRGKVIFKSESIEKAAHKLHYRTTFAGMPISIENRKGSYRRWYDPHNKTEGKTFMHFAYGYIRRTEAADGDSVDCYIGPNENAPDVYVVRQMKTPLFEKYDEDKVMLGFDSYEAAKKAYMSQYNDPRFFGSMETMPLGVFREKVAKTFEEPGMVKGGFWLAKGGPSLGYVPRSSGQRAGCPTCKAPSYTMRAMHHPDPGMQKFSCTKCGTNFHTDAAEPSANIARSEGAEGAEGEEGNHGYHPGVMLSFKKRKPAATQRGPSTKGHIPLGLGATDRYDDYMRDQHMRSIKSKRLLTMGVLMKSFGGRYAKAPALRVGPDSEHTSIHVGDPGKSHADVFEKLPEHEQEHKFIESGFIGHDNKYYSRHRMKHLVAAAEGRHPDTLVRPDSLHIAPKSYEHVSFTEEHHARAHATMEDARKDAESVAAQHAAVVVGLRKQREG